MGLLELLIVAVGLSMDAFAVAVCKGLSLRNNRFIYALITGIFFGLFQALMPLIGYFLGTQFERYITSIDHWIAFILLGLIGLKMIKESRSCSTDAGPAFTLSNLLILSIATSIDALAVGITFAFLRVNIIQAVIIIGITTLILSFIGVRIGNLFGSSFKSKAEMFGGVILIAMGLKILLEHLQIIQF